MPSSCNSRSAPKRARISLEKKRPASKKGILKTAFQKTAWRKKLLTSFPLAFLILYLVALPIPSIEPRAFIMPYKGRTRFKTASPSLPE